MGSHTNDPGEAGDVRGREFWPIAAATLVSTWVACSGMMWPHATAARLLAVAAGLLGWTFAVMAIGRPRYRTVLALVGAVLALSTPFVAHDRATFLNHTVSGVVLLILGLFHRPLADVHPAPIRHHHAPLSEEARRFIHGMGWGMAATVAMGAVVSLAVAVKLWPLGHPLSILVAQRLLGVGVLAALPVVAVAQLAYGALCGGLLATFSEHVDMGDALALGFLRWLTTQLIVFSLLGWGEFALEGAPLLVVATAVPHLAYALSLGWLMHRDHLTGVPARPALATR